MSAPAVSSFTLITEPIIWHNFFTERDLTWMLLRGRIGYRKGDLVVKGENNTPVIVSPKDPPISWSLFEAVQIRMLAEGGKEIKIKIGDQEFKQKLGPLRQYNVYCFDFNIDAPAGSRSLAIMPTDSLNDLAAISSIELLPRKTSFTLAAGRQIFGKREEYRDTLYAHSPSTVTFEVPIIVVILARMGFVTIKKLRQIRPYVIVGAFVVSAVVTPPDVFSQLILAVPLIILYEVGIIAARIIVGKDKIKEQEAEAAEDVKREQD